MPDTTSPAPFPSSCNPIGYSVTGPETAVAPPPADVFRVGATGSAVLELRVRNHPGTMSHITGLFARRAFNLDAIVCVPVGDGSTSCILLLVAREPRLDQVERQLTRLHDVLSVRVRPDLDTGYFTRVLASAAT